MAFPSSSSDRSPVSATRSVAAARTRCRSFCFLEHNGEPWTAFLVTYAESDTHWKGHFMFRSAAMAPENGEIRTADLFVEDSEAAVDARARSLGRPLLQALLQSALHTQASRRGVSGEYVRWFRELLARHAAQVTHERGDATRSMQRLHQLYDSYRTEQVSHLIALIEPDAFRHVVEQLLDGREIDFRAHDRFQLAMVVVQELERMIALPPFEVWVEDYLAHRVEYERYTAALRGGELP